MTKANFEDIDFVTTTSVNKLDSVVTEVKSKLEFLRKMLKSITDVDFSTEEALRHWEKITLHRNEISQKLDHEVDISVAIIDYFMSVNKILKTPVVMECSLLEKLQKCASTDFLTNIYNRHFFHESLGKEIARAGRNKTSFSLMFFDIDGFKIFNDTHGHQKGDEALVHIASVIKNMLRAQDIPCRYGGDEFLCLLPDTNYFYALSIAERVRKSTVGLPSDMGLDVTLSLSYGITTYPMDGDKSEELIKTCDARLYVCKEESQMLRKKIPQERRTNPRIKTPDSRGFLYKNQYEKLDVGILDIGHGGLSFTSHEPAETGSIYQMQLFLKPPLSTAWAEVEMLHLQNLSDGEFRIGCRLTGINFT